MKLKDILALACEEDASDMHIMAERPVMIRADGKLRPLGESAVTAEEMEEILQAFLTKAKKERLDKEGEVCLAVTVSGFLRLRVNIYRQRGTYALSSRIMPLEIPKPQELDLPASVINLAKEKKGLVLITGESGSGTSMTAASLLSQIAGSGAKHIVTIENPIEYLIESKTGIVSQREIGSDAKDFARALDMAEKQDADVIFASELPDAQSVLSALKAAESGRLVLFSMRVAQTEHALNRLLGLVPGDMRDFARVQLADVLKGVVWQQLLPRRGAEGRSAVFETLLADPSIRSLIRSDRISQISAAMEEKKELGMQSMDDAILDAYTKSRISEETAAEYAVNKSRMRQWMKVY